jgi:hypothetical protein
VVNADQLAHANAVLDLHGRLVDAAIILDEAKALAVQAADSADRLGDATRADLYRGLAGRIADRAADVRELVCPVRPHAEAASVLLAELGET